MVDFSDAAQVGTWQSVNDVVMGGRSTGVLTHETDDTGSRGIKDMSGKKIRNTHICAHALVLERNVSRVCACAIALLQEINLLSPSFELTKKSTGIFQGVVTSAGGGGFSSVRSGYVISMIFMCLCL